MKTMNTPYIPGENFPLLLPIGFLQTSLEVILCIVLVVWAFLFAFKAYRKKTDLRKSVHPPPLPKRNDEDDDPWKIRPRTVQFLKDTQRDSDEPEPGQPPTPPTDDASESPFFIKNIWNGLPNEAGDSARFFKNVSDHFHRDIHQGYKEICKKENWSMANMQKLKALKENPRTYAPGRGDSLYAKPMKAQLNKVRALHLNKWVFASGLIGMDKAPENVDHGPELDSRLGAMTFGTMEIGISLNIRDCADWERDLFHQIALTLNYKPMGRFLDHEALWKSNKTGVVNTIINFQAALQSEIPETVRAAALKILENQSAVWELRRRGGKLQSAFLEWQESVYRKTDQRVFGQVAKSKGIPFRNVRFVQVLDPFKFWPLRLGRRVQYQWLPETAFATESLPAEGWRDLPPEEALEIYAPAFYEESGGAKHYPGVDPKSFVNAMSQQFESRLSLETVKIEKESA